jgi:lipopolysaccharide exporter
MSTTASPAPPPPNENIAGTVRSGLMLSGGTDTVRQVLETGTGIILARLLVPADFGVVAVVGSILQLSFVISNFGMGTAVVQARSLRPNDRHTAFLISTLVGLLLMIGTCAAAPWAARYFSMPALIRIAPIMSIQLLLSGISSIPLSFLRRELKYGKLALIDLSGSIVYAAVGMPLALLGYGVWSLVWAPLASATWTMAAALVSARYRPRFWIDRRALRTFLSFGGGLTLKNAFVYVGRNMDNLIVAKFLGDANVGLYTRAFNLTRLPQNRMVALVYRICFPAFCKFQDDLPRLHRWYANATALVAVAATPLLLGIAAVSDDFVVAVLGPQWAGMATTMRILSFGALLSCFHMLGGAAIEASGRIRYEVMTQGIYAVGIVFGSILGCRFGIEGVAYGVLISSVVLYSLKGMTLRAAISLPARDYVGAALPALVSGLFMYACVHALLVFGAEHWTLLAAGRHWPRLLSATLAGVAAYALALAIVARPHLTMFVEQVRLALRRSRSAPAVPSARGLSA